MISHSVAAQCGCCLSPTTKVVPHSPVKPLPPLNIVDPVKRLESSETSGVTMIGVSAADTPGTEMQLIESSAIGRWVTDAFLLWLNFPL